MLGLLWLCAGAACSDPGTPHIPLPSFFPIPSSILGLLSPVLTAVFSPIFWLSCPTLTPKIWPQDLETLYLRCWILSQNGFFGRELESGFGGCLCITKLIMPWECLWDFPCPPPSQVFSFLTNSLEVRCHKRATNGHTEQI